jgi:hypothetical protein
MLLRASYFFELGSKPSGGLCLSLSGGPCTGLFLSPGPLLPGPPPAFLLSANAVAEARPNAAASTIASTVFVSGRRGGL